MLPYIELNAHHIGKSHIQSELDCEDYSARYSDGSISIVVISDGHGDKNCFRSKLGAKYACDISIELSRRFQQYTEHIEDISTCDFESLLTDLEGDIKDAWKQKVLSDVQSNPFSEEELLQTTEQAQTSYRAGSRLERAYGCTLILAVITGHYWFGIQIGDGKCVAAYDDGVFVEPIPADKENCVGNRSTSLCNSNAEELFRHYFSASLPNAVFVVSDGVEESFDQAGLYNFFFSAAYWMQEADNSGAEAKLKDLLPQISEGGSGDDVSISLAVSTANPLAKPRQTMEQVYEKVSAIENALLSYDEMLENAKECIAENDKAVESEKQSIKKLEAEIASKQKIIDEIIVRENEAKESIKTITNKKEKTLEQLEKMQKFKDNAASFWRDKYMGFGLPFPEEEKVPSDNQNPAAAEAGEPNSELPAEMTPQTFEVSAIKDSTPEEETPAEKEGSPEEESTLRVVEDTSISVSEQGSEKNEAESAPETAATTYEEKPLAQPQMREEDSVPPLNPEAKEKKSWFFHKRPEKEKGERL